VHIEVVPHHDEGPASYWWAASSSAAQSASVTSLALVAAAPADVLDAALRALLRDGYAGLDLAPTRKNSAPVRKTGDEQDRKGRRVCRPAAVMVAR